MHVGMKKKIMIALVCGLVLIGGVLILIKVLGNEKKSHSDEDTPQSENTVTPTSDTTNTPTPTIEVKEPKYHVGDIVVLGKYEQDGKADNGAENIEWIVLDVKETSVLIISKYALAAMPFHNAAGETNWETGSIRTWLNGEFIEKAFDETERTYLTTSSVENKDYYLGITAEGILKAQNTGDGLEEVAYHTAGGNTTTDKVFLLSVDEANEYFSTSEDRSSVFTSAAREQFLGYCIEDAKAYGMTDEKMIRDNVEKWEQEHGTGSCYWWLRSPGMSSSYCSVVDIDGKMINSQSADNKEGGVRPAMWVILPE